MVLLYLFIFMCFSCSSSEDSRGDVVARVNEKKLTKEQLVSWLGQPRTTQGLFFSQQIGG